MTPREIAEEVYHRACQRWVTSRGLTFRDAFVAEIAAALKEAAEKAGRRG
ncbi:MAG: hypothetical protein FJ090_14790 [Deltaproteobacteria bacterium]|nr:hypothetical protein [Deltaproteobacteria bacterium]